MSEPNQAYNPLDRKNLGFSVAEALLASEAHPLPLKEAFKGAGIYVIYYTGSFAPYKKIAEENKDGFQLPIYVGKAVPAGARKGSTFDNYDGTALFSRIQEHAESINQAPNLKVEDFFCRYLVVEDVWIPLGETLLINKFSPLWNQVIDGFGNHDPGSGRYAQKKSAWDVLHPGRAWANKLTGAHPELSTIEATIAEYSSRVKNEKL